MRIRFASFMSLSLFFFTTSDAQSLKSKTVPQLGKNTIQEVIKAMTLEEKSRLVVGAEEYPRGYPSLFGGPDTLFGKVPNIVGKTEVLVPGSAGTTYAIPRLGITSLVLADGQAGIRISPTREGSSKTYYATAFPVATLLASTWDTALVKQVGKAMGNEVLEYGADVLLAPALNIHRNPLGGRNFEYYSEDPLVSGMMAAAMVNGVQSNGVGTSIKHFAANNNETNRMTINAVVSERALREIYLKGFSIAVKKSQPWTLMSSYNKINGTFASERPDLQTIILRNEWVFKGFVMTDWFAGRSPVAQQIAGNDLLMPGSTYMIKQIADAVKNGTLDEKLLDRNVAAILSIVVKSPRFNKYKFSNKPDLKANAVVSRQAATEGMVLLKNNNVLPMVSTTTKIAFFGNASYETIAGGTGSGDVNKAYSVSIVDGFKNAGYQTNDSLRAYYNRFIKYAKDTLARPASFMDRKPLISEMVVGVELANKLANETDVAVVTISRNSGEFHDRTLEGDYYLTGIEWFKVDMGTINYFDQLAFDAGDYNQDYARKYKVQVSKDDVVWTDLESGDGLKWINLNFGALEARYIRIYQTGTSSTNTWSIAEVNAYMDDDFSVRSTLNFRFGEDAADKLWDSYQEAWIQESDFDNIKGMGMNMVRIPIYWKELMHDNGTMKAEAFKQLDWAVQLCTKKRIYIILDLHGAPGGVDGYITSGQALKNELWTSPLYQQMTVNIWKAIATHYKGNPTIAVYDLLNEPVSSGLPGALATKQMYDMLYKAVKPIDPDHVIGMGAFYNFDFLGSPESNGWTNVIYQGHYYNTDFDNWGSQSGFIDWALGDLDSHRKMWNVPVYAGEYNFWNHLDLWKKFMGGLNNNNISWSNWTYKNMTTGKNWGFYQGNTNAIPDMNHDDYETIKSKWSKFSTSNFSTNTNLINTVKEYTGAKPVGN